MKQKNTFIGWAFLLSIIVLLLLIGDILALADINKDYVSAQVLETLSITIANQLPDWTAATLEWTVLQISFVLKLIFSLTIIIALAKATRQLKA